MLNHITLMGRLTRDPELRHTANGTAVASFAIACDRDFQSKATQEKTVDFIDIVAWRNTAEFVSKYFTKGSMAVVSGRLQIREWNDKDGNKRRSAEVVAENVYFGSSKRDTSGNNGYSEYSGGYAAPADSYSAPGGYSTPVTQPVNDFSMLDSDDSDLPF